MISAKVYIGDVLVSGGTDKYQTDKFLVFEPSPHDPNNWLVKASDQQSLYDAIDISQGNYLELMIPYKHEGRFVDCIGSFNMLAPYVDKITFLSPSPHDPDVHMQPFEIFVEHYAFQFFQELKEVYLGDRVTLAPYMFDQCYQLRRLSFDMRDNMTGAYYNTRFYDVLGWGVNQLEYLEVRNFPHLTGWWGGNLDYFFANCSGLREIVFTCETNHWQDMRIPQYFFENCHSLGTVRFRQRHIMPDRVDDYNFDPRIVVGAWACVNCGFEEFPFKFVEEIEFNAFQGCPFNLGTLYLGAQYELDTLVIHDGAFDSAQFRDVVIRAREVHLHSTAFSNCNNLESFSLLPVSGHINTNLRLYGDYIFGYDDRVIKLDAPLCEVTSNYAFGNTRLPIVTLGDGNNFMPGVFLNTGTEVVYINHPFLLQDVNNEEDFGSLFEHVKLIYILNEGEVQVGQYISDNFYLLTTLFEDKQHPFTGQTLSYQVWCRN